jgi:hypothetical protein
LRASAVECIGDYAPPPDLGEPLGGVVPHAGWMFSGPTAAKLFVCLARAGFETYVLLGAVHAWPGRRAAVYPDGAWGTPLGDIAVDAELAAALLDKGEETVLASTAAHDLEHSIEVQLPFIQLLAPSARILPVAVPHIAGVLRVGRAVAEAIRATGRRAAVVASTDLTHYGMGYGAPSHGPLRGALDWMRANDRRILDLAERLEAEEIVPEAEQNENACGPGALAAAVAAARDLGAARGRLLEYTTSADVLRERDADRAVGYAAMVFEKAEESGGTAS